MPIQPGQDISMIAMIEYIIEHRVQQQVYEAVQQYILALAMQKYLQELKNIHQAA